MGEPDTLTARLASTATGYGAVIDGVLDVRTIDETRKSAARRAFATAGIGVVTGCQDPGCDCLVRALASAMPKARIVEVTVEAIDG